MPGKCLRTLSAPDAVTVGGVRTVARFGLRHAQSRPGESVLVRGAAGGVAVQFASRQGAGEVFGEGCPRALASDLGAG